MRRLMWMLAGADFVLAVLAVYGAALVRFFGTVSDELRLERALVFAAFVVIGLTCMGLYQGQQRLHFEGVLARIIVGFGVATLGLTLMYFVVPPFAMARGWWSLSVGFAFLFVAAALGAFLGFGDGDRLRRRVIVYGAGGRAANLLKLRRRSDQRGFKIVAFIPVPGERRAVEDERVDEQSAGLSQLAVKHDANEIVIAMDERRRAFRFEELLECRPLIVRCDARRDDACAVSRRSHVHKSSID